MGLFIGPIISGPLSDRYGWRSFFWLATGLAVSNLILLAAFFPETKFHRTLSTPDRSEQASTSEKGQSAQVETANNERLDRTMTASAAFVGKGRPGRKHFMLFRAPDSRWK
jgi:MFS family permease